MPTQYNSLEPNLLLWWTRPCQCNVPCLSFQDCCDDFIDVVRCDLLVTRACGRPTHPFSVCKFCSATQSSRPHPHLHQKGHRRLQYQTHSHLQLTLLPSSSVRLQVGKPCRWSTTRLDNIPMLDILVLIGGSVRYAPILQTLPTTRLSCQTSTSMALRDLPASSSCSTSTASQLICPTDGSWSDSPTVCDLQKAGNDPSFALLPCGLFLTYIPLALGCSSSKRRSSDPCRPFGCHPSPIRLHCRCSGHLLLRSLP